MKSHWVDVTSLERNEPNIYGNDFATKLISVKDIIRRSIGIEVVWVIQLMH